MKRKRTGRARSVFLFLFLFFVLWYTVLKRRTSYHSAQTELFWSYRLWFSGNEELGWEIVSNVAMFIPFGFLFMAVLGQKQGKAWTVFLSAVLFSLLIESLQLVLMRGLFEWDDVFNNTVGAILGWGLYQVIYRLTQKRNNAFIITLVCFSCILVCAGLFFTGQGETEEEEDSSSKSFCFQIDEAVMDGGEITLSGFGFIYKRESSPICLILSSTATGNKVNLQTKYGLYRADVNDYFFCDYDYSYSGFVASGKIDETEEYEVMFRFPWSVPISTGVYISASGVHYVPEKAFTAPKIEADFVKSGTLRVYRPDYHCWVYQYKGVLYWIVDQDFYFEPDNTTYIQYQLWTTQTENLPEKRLEKGNLWDNIGGYFEKNEIEGYGPYRVMKRELPTAYAITSIVTGYYREGKWIWKEYFRPMYQFSK